jgi:glyoxylate reductase
MRRAVARCFVTRALPGPALDRLRERHDVDLWPGRLPPPYEELRARTTEAEGLLSLLTDRVDAALIEGSRRLRAIANYAVGYDNIDLDAARARGIPVGNTPDVLTDATADLTFTLLLAAARRLPDALLSVQADDWVTWEPGAFLGHDVFGATLGIIGLGRIGRAVARRAQGFDMTVLHSGPDGGVPLLTLLARSDFVSLHTPLTPETHHLIDAAALEAMKPTAILINTARGGLVDEAALAEALKAATIAGAGFDVLTKEPPKDGNILLDPSIPNLIVTPHVAWASQEAMQILADQLIDNIEAFVAGKPQNVVKD